MGHSADPHETGAEGSAMPSGNAVHKDFARLRDLGNDFAHDGSADTQ